MKKLLFTVFLFAFFSFNTLFSQCIFADYTEIEVNDCGNIVGNVRYMGELTTLNLDLYRDWDLSYKQKTAPEKLVVNKNNNGIKNAIVSIKNISRGKKREIPLIRPVIDQQRSTFIPHVTAILAGTTVDILNGDEELHTIHTRSVNNQPFNLGTTYKQRISKRFDYPEMIKLSCDLHKKTYAWIVVLDNPYFEITDRNGYFEICDVPAGVYELQVWHEELGKLEKEVTVKTKETTNLEFVYSQN